MTVEVGKMAPDFTLSNQDGENVSLADFKGKHVVLYFYPKDMTPGCTTEACDFRDQKENFGELNAVIVGISPDPADSHQEFINKHDLPFLLLADEDHQVSEEYGAWKLKEKSGSYGMERSTFIIDKEGKLQKEFRNVQVKGHVEEALTFIKENL